MGRRPAAELGHGGLSDPTQARSIAADVAGRVLRSGAFSNILVDKASAGLSAQDRGRVKALVFGVLRHLEEIDAAIEQGRGKPLATIDSPILDRLRVSAFELLYGDLPGPVAVSAGVDLVRAGNPRGAGMANAVLRRVSTRERPPPSGLSLPPWLVSRLRREWGEEAVQAFALASAEEPQRVVRTRNRGVGAGFGGVHGAMAVGPGPIPEGTVVQDAASIAVGEAVAAEPGMRVLDMAAAPGGKTLHLLDQVGGEGLVLAMDSHPRRARDAARRAPGALWVVGDGTRPPLVEGAFDRVLLDAPCSGLGSLRRRPEIRLRVTESDVAGLAALQRRMLEAALPLLAPGGSLVYSVCTVTPEETIDIVADLDFRPADLPGAIWGKGRLLAPHITSTDGMFVSVHVG